MALLLSPAQKPIVALTWSHTFPEQMQPQLQLNYYVNNQKHSGLWLLAHSLASGEQATEQLSGVALPEGQYPDGTPVYGEVLVKLKPGDFPLLFWADEAGEWEVEMIGLGEIADIFYAQVYSGVTGITLPKNSTAQIPAGGSIDRFMINIRNHNTEEMRITAVMTITKPDETSSRYNNTVIVPPGESKFAGINIMISDPQPGAWYVGFEIRENSQTGLLLDVFETGLEVL